MQEGRSALMVAAGEGHDSCVLVLASNGAEVNMVDRVSETGRERKGREWLGSCSLCILVV